MTRPLSGYRIGFIGLGLMGRPMCLNLHRAGAEIHAWNRTRHSALELEQEYLKIEDSPAAVAEKTDFIVIMVADTPAVSSVLTDSQGLLTALRKDSVVIDMGTTAVTATREFARIVEARGGHYIDAPVSGGVIGARDGDLSIMAGGSIDSIARASPLFDVLGKSTVHIGATGTGQVTKAANQVIVGLNIGAVAEALLLAKRAGADLDRVREALLGGFAASRVLEVHGQRMIDATFEPGGKVTTQHKDLSQALDLATEFGLDLPATALNRALYQSLIDSGRGSLDHSALILALDKD